jgi:steroid delta-isomerase-like uncharacterized protein
MAQPLMRLIVLILLSTCFPTATHAQTAREEAKKIAVAYIEQVVNQRKLDVLPTLFSPDYISHDRYGTDFQTIKDGSLVTFLRYFFQAFPDLRYTILQAITEADLVALNTQVEGTHEGEFLGFEPSGNTVSFREMFFFRIRDGKITEGWSVVDVEQVKGQLKKK